MASISASRHEKSAPWQLEHTGTSRLAAGSEDTSFASDAAAVTVAPGLEPASFAAAGPPIDD
jgi:hypothetical protein